MKNIKSKGCFAKSFTQNEKLIQVTADTLIVGVDIGLQTHFSRAFDWRGVELGK